MRDGSGWIALPLGQVATLQRGYDLPSSRREDGEVPIVSSGGVSGWHSQHKHEAPGVVTGRYGSIGEVYWVDEPYWPLNTTLFVIDFHSNHPPFVYYLLKSLDYFRLSDKTGVPGVNRNDLHKIEVLRPPLPEQRKIAEILRTWDEALEKLTALRTAKLKRARGLTVALVFGAWQLDRFRTTDEVARHRWFQLPASWSCRSIGDLAVEISERNNDGDHLEVLSCSKHDGFVRSLEFFKKQVFSADLTGYKKIWRGDFGFPSNHVEEGSIGLQNLTDIGVVSPIYTVFRFNPDAVLAEYAFAVLKTEVYRHIFEVSTSATVDRRGSLRWSEFSRLPFPVPPLAEQEAIAEVLRTSQRELDALTDEIEAVSRQKRGLMQKLLTGQWSVDTSEMTEAAQ